MGTTPHETENYAATAKEPSEVSREAWNRSFPCVFRRNTVLLCLDLGLPGSRACPCPLLPCGCPGNLVGCLEDSPRLHPHSPSIGHLTLKRRVQNSQSLAPLSSVWSPERDQQPRIGPFVARTAARCPANDSTSCCKVSRLPHTPSHFTVSAPTSPAGVPGRVHRSDLVGQAILFAPPDPPFGLLHSALSPDRLASGGCVPREALPPSFWLDLTSGPHQQEGRRRAG